jgi:SPP1 family phage portal protein
LRLSKEAFQAWFEGQEDNTRLKDYRDYDNYYYGKFDDIEMPKHIEESLGVDLAIHANYCRAIVDTKVQYICGGPLSITALSEEEDDEEADSGEKYLYRVYKANNLLHRNATKTTRIHTKKGDVFLKVAYDEENKSWMQAFFDKFKGLFKSGDIKDREFAQNVKVRVLKPDNVFPKYADDDYEDMQMCAIKYYEYSDDGDQEWRAQVWYPEVVESWVRKDDAGWEFEDEEENELGFVPIVHIKNGNDDREFGVSDLYVMHESQNLLNKTLTDLMLTMDYQAFQRLIIIGAMTRRGQKWDISPGTVQEIPNADASVEVIEAADIAPLLETVRELKSTICEVTQTPQVALGNVEGGIPSGYALRIHYQPLENKAAEAILALQNGFMQLNYMLFALANVHDKDYGMWDTEITFKSGLPIDEMSVVEKHTKQLANGTLSVDSAMQAEGVEDIEAEKAKIAEEGYDVYGGAERTVQEAEALAATLENVELTTEPRPEEV